MTDSHDKIVLGSCFRIGRAHPLCWAMALVNAHGIYTGTRASVAGQALELALMGCGSF